jgi:hypothetical protein
MIPKRSTDPRETSPRITENYAFAPTRREEMMSRCMKSVTRVWRYSNGLDLGNLRPNRSECEIHIQPTARRVSVARNVAATCIPEKVRSLAGVLQSASHVCCNYAIRPDHVLSFGDRAL